MNSIGSGVSTRETMYVKREAAAVLSLGNKVRTERYASYLKLLCMESYQKGKPRS